MFELLCIYDKLHIQPFIDLRESYYVGYQNNNSVDLVANVKVNEPIRTVFRTALK